MEGKERKQGKEGGRTEGKKERKKGRKEGRKERRGRKEGRKRKKEGNELYVRLCFSGYELAIVSLEKGSRLVRLEVVG